jgi:cysteine desulfurase
MQPVKLLASLAHQASALFHCDAVQAAGRVALDVSSTEINLLSVSAHKMHGPKEVGALYVRKGARFSPLIFGGRQEFGRRAGTQNVAGIVGFGVAADLASNCSSGEAQRIAKMRLRTSFRGRVNQKCSLLAGSHRYRGPDTLAAPTGTGTGVNDKAPGR